MKEKGTIRLQKGSVGWWNGFGTYYLVRMIRFWLLVRENNGTMLNYSV